MSHGEKWYVFALNAEPWVVPPMSPGRRNGKLRVVSGQDPALFAYQEALREAFGKPDPYPKDRYLQVAFYFWRNQAQYIGTRSVKKNAADATNLLKSTEDALQGYLYDNDRNNRDVRAVVVDQGPDVSPAIAIHVQELGGNSYGAHNLPHSIWQRVEEVQHHESTLPIFDNEWPPRSKQ